MQLTTCRMAAEQTLRSAITWGRYAELFAYDEETRLCSALRTRARRQRRDEAPELGKKPQAEMSAMGH